jgi:nicotinamide-nucleotide amidase
MKAEIIAVGSELLTPDHIETDSLSITRCVNKAGFRVRLKTIVGDNRKDIEAVLAAALLRSDLIFLIGGLGPTEDDITRIAVAGVLGRPLALDNSVLEMLKQRFAARKYKMAKINERQAEVIAGAQILDNPVGTAPGMWIEDKGRHIVLLPGPPRELNPMLETEIMPRLGELGGTRNLAYKHFNIIGMTESEADSRIAPIYTSYPEIQTTILAGPKGIALHMYRWFEAREEPRDLDELAAKIHEALGDAIFSTSGEPLEQVVGQMLRQSGKTLSVAESCTGGMLGMYITRIPGSSDYFLGGILCYSNEAKKNLCGVPEELLQKHGAVSAEVAEALARGVRDALHSTIGLSITGVAGPGGATAEKPVGLVYIGLSDGTRTMSSQRILPGDRDTIRERSTYLALMLLRKFLM